MIAVLYKISMQINCLRGVLHAQGSAPEMSQKCSVAEKSYHLSSLMYSTSFVFGIVGALAIKMSCPKEGPRKSKRLESSETNSQIKLA